MNCDICGKDTNLFMTEIEGTKLNVCKGCSVYGKVVRQVRKPTPHRKNKVHRQETEDKIQRIIHDYSIKIKIAREKLGLKQEEFAKRINEKTSIIHSLESNKSRPSMSLARKLEKTLNLTLIEEFKNSELPKIEKSKRGNELTIGDLIKVKK